MDYEKKYKEALDRAKNIYGASECKDIWCTLETIFPEIKESESDRMRKGIIEELVHLIDGINVISNKSIERKHQLYEYIDWLEEQGDKVEPISKQDDMRLLTIMKEAGYELDAKNEQLKKIEQNPAWSEEDERAIGIIKIALEHPYDMEGKWDRKFALDWLKSLKERYTWKPSKEQMDALDEVYKTHGANSACRRVLITLLNDLKKLMEE